jgi:hypothetical protein
MEMVGGGGGGANESSRSKDGVGTGGAWKSISGVT